MRRKAFWVYTAWRYRRAIVDGFNRGRKPKQPVTTAFTNALLKEFYVEPIREMLNQKSFIYEWTIKRPYDWEIHGLER